MYNRGNPAKFVGGIVAFLENPRTVNWIVSMMNKMAEVVHDPDFAADTIEN